MTLLAVTWSTLASCLQDQTQPDPDALCYGFRAAIAHQQSGGECVVDQVRMQVVYYLNVLPMSEEAATPLCTGFAELLGRYQPDSAGVYTLVLKSVDQYEPLTACEIPTGVAVTND